MNFVKLNLTSRLWIDFCLVDTPMHRYRCEGVISVATQYTAISGHFVWIISVILHVSCMFFSFTDMLSHFKSISLITNYNYNSHIITYQNIQFCSWLLWGLCVYLCTDRCILIKIYHLYVTFIQLVFCEPCNYMVDHVKTTWKMSGSIPVYKFQMAPLV